MKSGILLEEKKSVRTATQDNATLMADYQNSLIHEFENDKLDRSEFLEQAKEE